MMVDRVITITLLGGREKATSFFVNLFMLQELNKKTGDRHDVIE